MAENSKSNIGAKGALQPPADVAGLEDALRAQRPDLDIYWSPSLAEGKGQDVVNWTLNADDPEGREYAAIDFEVYDRHEALELVTEDPDEASKRRRGAHGWTNTHTHTAAAILDNTAKQTTDGGMDAAGAVAVEREVIGGADAEPIMREVVETNADGWAGLDPGQVNYKELVDRRFDDMGMDLDEDRQKRLRSYENPEHGIAGQLKEITVRRGAYMEASEQGQTIDEVSETTPVYAENERTVQNQAGSRFFTEVQQVPAQGQAAARAESKGAEVDQQMQMNQMLHSQAGTAGPGMS